MPDSINKLSDDDMEKVAGGTTKEEMSKVGHSPADAEKLSKGGKVVSGGHGGSVLPPPKGPKRP